MHAESCPLLAVRLRGDPILIAQNKQLFAEQISARERPSTFTPHSRRQSVLSGPAADQQHKLFAPARASRRRHGMVVVTAASSHAPSVSVASAAPRKGVKCLSPLDWRAHTATCGDGHYGQMMMDAERDVDRTRCAECASLPKGRCFLYVCVLFYIITES